MRERISFIFLSKIVFDAPIKYNKSFTIVAPSETRPQRTQQTSISITGILQASVSAEVANVGVSVVVQGDGGVFANSS